MRSTEEVVSSSDYKTTWGKEARSLYDWKHFSSGVGVEKTYSREGGHAARPDYYQNCSVYMNKIANQYCTVTYQSYVRAISTCITSQKSNLQWTTKALNDFQFKHSRCSQDEMTRTQFLEPNFFFDTRPCKESYGNVVDLGLVLGNSKRLRLKRPFVNLYRLV